MAVIEPGPFESATVLSLAALVFVIFCELLLWLVMKALTRVGVYTPIGPLDRRMRKMILFTIIMGLFLGVVVVLTYGMWVSLFEGKPQGIRIH